MMRDPHEKSAMVRALRAVMALGLAAALACAVVLVMLPASLSEDKVRTRVNERLDQWTGGALRLRPETRIDVQSGFRVLISDPVLARATDGTGLDASASAIEVTLRLWPLLAGRVEIMTLKLLEPDIRLADGAAALSLFSRTGEPAATTGRAGAVGDVVIVDGSVQIAGNAARDDGGTLSDLDLRLSSLEEAGAALLDARFEFEDRPVHLTLRLDAPELLHSDRGTPGHLSLGFGPRTAPVSNEETDDVPTLGIGERAARLAMQLSLLGFDTLRVDGQFSLRPESIAIEAATFEAGGVSLEGALRAGVMPGRPFLSHLHRLQDAADAITRAVRDDTWQDAPLSLAWLDGLDIDLSLSGSDIGSGATRLDAADVSLLVREGTAQLDLAGRGPGFGDFRAGLRLVSGTDGVKASAFGLDGRVRDMAVGETAQIISALIPPPPIGTPQFPEGLLTGEIDLAGSGDTLGEVVEGLTGSARGTLTDGSLAGGDVVATLQSLSEGREFMTDEKGPLIPASGRTSFDTMEVQAELADGIMSLSRNTIVGERYEIDMAGVVGLRGGVMNIAGNALLFDGTARGEPAHIAEVDLPFGLGGTLFGPVIAAGVPQGIKTLAE